MTSITAAAHAGRHTDSVRYGGHRGFTLVSLLLVFVAVAALYLILLNGGDTPDQPPDPRLDIRQARQVGQDTACRGNRRELQRSLLTWSATHPGQSAGLDALREAGFHVPDCPGGGRLSIYGGSVVCSRHGE